MLATNPTLIDWYFAWQRDDRLREAEADRLASLAQLFAFTQRTPNPQRKDEV